MATDELSDGHRLVLSTWASTFSRAAATAVNSCVADLGRLAVAIRRALDLPVGSRLEPVRREVLDALASGAAGKFGFWPNLTVSVRALLSAIDGSEAAPGVLPDLERIFGDLERDYLVSLSDPDVLRDVLEVARDALLESDAGVRTEVSRAISSLVADPQIRRRSCGSSPSRGAPGDSAATPGDLRTSWGEPVDVDSLISARDHGRSPLDLIVPPITDQIGSLAHRALDGEASAIDGFALLAGTVVRGVDELNFERSVWLAAYDLPGGVRHCFVAQTESEDGSFGVAIDASQLVAWIGSETGRAWLAARGISLPGPSLRLRQSIASVGSVAADLVVADPVAVESDVADSGLFVRVINRHGGISVCFRIWGSSGDSAEHVALQLRRMQGYASSVGMRFCFLVSRDLVWGWDASSADLVFSLSTLALFSTYVRSAHDFGTGTTSPVHLAEEKIRSAGPEYLAGLTCAWLSDLTSHWHSEVGAAPGEDQMRCGELLHLIVSASSFRQILV